MLKQHIPDADRGVRRISRNHVFGRWYWSVDTTTDLMTRNGSVKHRISGCGFVIFRRRGHRAIARLAREHTKRPCTCEAYFRRRA